MWEVVQEELFWEKETEYIASISNVWLTLYSEEHGEQNPTDTEAKIAKNDILLQAIFDYMENPQNENDKGAALCVKVVIGEMDVQELRTMKNRPRVLNFHPLVKGER